MKHIISLTLLSAGSLALADISMGNGAPVVPAVQEAPSPEAQEYIAIAQDILSIVKELNQVLSGVNDLASADAAAPQMQDMTMRMIELQKRSEKLERPTAEIEQQVRASFDTHEVQQLVTTFVNSLIRIGMNNAYGSQTFMNALSPALNALPGKGE